MPDIKLVIFDIAGTIIEDHGEVLDAFAQALRFHGVAFDELQLKEWKGASKREVIRHFVEHENHGKPGCVEKVEKTYGTFRRQLEDYYRGRVDPIPGAAGTFAWCRERGIQLATTTGFYREVSELILTRTGWESLFAAKISSSDVARGRPAPFMIFRAMETAGVEHVRQVMNVGDTPLDLQAATNAGVRGVVGVLTGSHGEERLRREPHTHLIPSVAEIPALIEREF